MERGETVRTGKIYERVFFFLAFSVLQNDLSRVDMAYGSIFPSDDKAAGVARGGLFDTCRYERRFRKEAWRRLFLHVRTHERAVRVVMVEERDHGSRHREGLIGSDVDIVDCLTLHELGFPVETDLDF